MAPVQQNAFRLRGSRAEILWGYRTAATISSWSISRKKDVWTLTAKAEHVDEYQARQRPLMFTAPRPGGFWSWPIESLHVGPSQLVAELGQPEH